MHGFELQVEALPLQTAETGAAQAEAGFSPGPQAVFHHREDVAFALGCWEVSRKLKAGSHVI